ncbi:hypothetical protein HU200_000304 [Digitaria exilis]|uniref:Uncharacterized protein n=1 Tax=Digitaria exilis TaxID=1010633 RepID=A0A835G1X7_9POAL|nr:hypothetical protein HU200_000304 [Digitaria exilis]
MKVHVVFTPNPT